MSATKAVATAWSFPTAVGWRVALAASASALRPPTTVCWSPVQTPSGPTEAFISTSATEAAATAWLFPTAARWRIGSRAAPSATRAPPPNNSVLVTGSQFALDQLAAHLSCRLQRQRQQSGHFQRRHGGQYRTATSAGHDQLLQQQRAGHRRGSRIVDQQRRTLRRLSKAAATAWSFPTAVAVANSLGAIGERTNSSNNSVLVTGTNSLWTNGGQLSLSATFGSGNSLVISNGGTVANAERRTSASRPTPPTTACWSPAAGSLWTNSERHLCRRLQGSGNSLVISNGGTVANSRSAPSAATQLRPNNSVLVTGAGSLWTNSGDLFVGYVGSSNSLVITNGGTVANTGGYIGYQCQLLQQQRAGHRRGLALDQQQRSLSSASKAAATA